ncbi:hypothetical protein [Kitasatospora sp. NPDC057015]|uniref:hypothetical protein n=1 Tax=Kitasatospora sp. NPDC057015 TaxID=3346001 RepID=UPI0036364210
MPADRFATLMGEDQLAALADATLGELAGRLAARAFRPLPADSPGGPQPGEPWETDPQHDALTRLHALMHLRKAAERLADQAAREAADAGAGYPQLGQACAISRQAARQRWPGLVPPNPAARHTPENRST